MQGGRQLVAWLSLLAAAGTLGAGCGSSDRGPPAGASLGNGTGGSTTGGTGGSSAASGTGGAGTGGTAGSGGTGGTIDVGTSGAGDSGPASDCGGEDHEPTLIPLDLYVMLDSSGSMAADTGSGTTKWAAIQSALTAFLADPASDGIGIGLQFFPQHDPNVPLTCTKSTECSSDNSNLCIRNFCQGARPDFYLCDGPADCKAGGKDYGPCTPLTYCWSSGGTQLCHDDRTDCNGVVGDCVEFNVCSGDDSYWCKNAGDPCVSQQGQNIGTCRYNDATECEHTSSCAPSAYATPASEIAPLPAAASGLTTVITAARPKGQTPTAPALAGAIDHARSWSSEHPDHSVVVVLATDGLPTECIADATGDPTGLDEVVRDAQAGVSGKPSVRTFVIGVFSKSEDQMLMAGANLDRIAVAGDSQSAFVIDAAGNVEHEFLAALDQIRGARLPCEYQIPTPTSGSFMKDQVNVVFTHDGTTDKLYYWSDASQCDATEGGWYYDDPNAPTKIIACPASCNAFQAAGTGSKVNINLGCRTLVK